MINQPEIFEAHFELDISFILESADNIAPKFIFVSSKQEIMLQFVKTFHLPLSSLEINICL